MIKYDFEESVGYWITLTHQSYFRTLESALAPHGITYRQAQVLAYLSIEGPLSQAELACRMMVEPPSLVGVIDRMEAGGLLERRPCPDDRRKKIIYPLASANRVWKKVVKCGKAVRAQATQNLSEREQATLKRLLKKVRDNVT